MHTESSSDLPKLVIVRICSRSKSCCWPRYGPILVQPRPAPVRQALDSPVRTTSRRFVAMFLPGSTFGFVRDDGQGPSLGGGQPRGDLDALDGRPSAGRRRYAHVGPRFRPERNGSREA
jgi:hypothetical protein